MRHLLLPAVLLTSTPALAGGFGGSDAPTRIPVPARVFDATILDASNTRIEATRVTWNGEVYLQGMVGAGHLSVPFEKVASFRVEPSDDAAHRILFVKLRSGDTTKLVVEEDTPCYGQTPAGYYMIEVGDLREVTFAAPPPPTTSP